MKNWSTVPIPQLMLDLERDPRGLPVPYVVLKDKEGKHHFKINDSEKSIICVVKNLCSICGKPLISGQKWLVGGIASAFDERGYYIDLPVHKECGTYALQVCPYMAMNNYNGKLDMIKLQQQLPTVALHNPTVDPDRLPLFVFQRPSAITAHMLQEQGLVIKAAKPILEAEFWVEGERILHLEEIVAKLEGTKWEKYLAEIVKLPQYDLQKA
jgi:hypothetical protein